MMHLGSAFQTGVPEGCLVRGQCSSSDDSVYALRHNGTRVTHISDPHVTPADEGGYAGRPAHAVVNAAAVQLAVQLRQDLLEACLWI